MNLYNKSILVFFAIILVFSSCSEKETSEELISSPNDAIEYYADYESVIEVMAQGLSKTIASEDWLQSISERSMSKENGDQVFVYGLAKDLKINTKTLSQNIFQSAALSPEKMDKYILSDFPLLSIALNGQDVNTDTKVFYDYRDDDDYLPSDEVYYFVKGEKYSMDYKDVDKKNDTYFIIRNNERVATVNEATGSLSKGIESDLKRVENLKDYFYSNRALLGTVDGVTYRLTYELETSQIEEIEETDDEKNGCYRDGNTKREGISHYRTTNDYDGGFNGSGEFEVQFTFTNQYGQEIDYYVRKTNIQDDNVIRTFGYGWNVLHWDRNYHGDRFEVALWEDDNSSDDGRYSGSFTANIPSVGNVGLSYDFGANSDDRIGTAEIDYCYFNYGWLSFGDAQLYCGAIY